MTKEFLNICPDLRFILLVCLLGCMMSCDVGKPTASNQYAPNSDVPDGMPTRQSRLIEIDPGHAQIRLHISGSSAALSDQQVTNWVQTASKAVSQYFDRFPVDHVVISVAFDGDGKVEGGVTNDRGISVRLGSSTTQADLADDWVMTHEMFHLSFPTMDDQYVWLSEGRATYLEPIARVRAGTISTARYWGDLVEGLPQGQPEAGDRGLDMTHTWGRTYWGGAMFCLMADLQIREQTGNVKSLDDAMRDVLNHGGNHLVEWPLESFVDVGDKATGTHVLRDLHKQMGTHAVTMDLPAIWRQLGILYNAGQIAFDDTAPLAKIRIAITR